MTKKKIITVTLNPSLDRTISVNYLGIGYHNKTQEETRLDPGGEGLSVSRALTRLGYETHAVVLLGKDATGKAYRSLIAEEPFDVKIISCEGKTRSNTIILDTGHNNETQITEDADPVTDTVRLQTEEALRELLSPGDIVYLTGALPSGSVEDVYADLIEVIRACGAKATASVSAQLLPSVLKANPDLVFITQVETEGYLNYPVRHWQDMVGSAAKLKKQGAVRVMIEMRDTGSAFFATPYGTRFIEFTDEPHGTTSGIWAALRAGVLAGWCVRDSVYDSLVLGAAAAAYTANQVGYEFGTMEDVQSYVGSAKIKKIRDMPQD